MSVVWESQPNIDAPAGARPRVRVWDGFTRLVHWLLVVLMGVSWWTARHHHMDYHRYSGYALLGVLIFRLYWGVFGSTTARFAHFVKGPRSIWHYLRSKARHVTPGHNPLGALSVLALLGLLLAQVTLGLFSVDVDGIESGPLSRWVSFEIGRECSRLHQLGFDVLKALVVLHIAAVVFYWIFKRDNLIRPMITGSKGWRHEALPHIEFASAWRALLGIALAVVLVWYVA
jgi:cytochrome b